MNKTGQKIRWGIVGLGRIANQFAEDIQSVPNAEVYAVASRDKEKSKRFAQKHQVGKFYDNYVDLSKDRHVDAVYVATPHAFHKEHTLLFLNRKKAVLCEKPFAMNGLQVKEMIDTAKTNNTLLMEAMWTFFLPHYQALLKVLQEGTIGDVVNIQADFGFNAVYDPESRLIKKELGGGSLLDIGIYPIFLALTVLGMPETIDATATFFDSGVDSACKMIFQYKNNVEARLESNLLELTPTEAIIVGTKGKMIIHKKFHAPSSFTIEKDNKVERFDFEVKTHGYSYEIEHFSSLLQNGKKESDIMNFNTSVQLMNLLDAVRNQIGLSY